MRRVRKMLTTTEGRRAASSASDQRPRAGEGLLSVGDDRRVGGLGHEHVVVEDLRADGRGDRPGGAGRDEDDGSCYRSGDFARIVGGDTKHRKTKPFRPQHNGKAERYQRIMTEEVLYAHEYNSENERSEAIATWNIHYNYHRPHSAAGGRPPASRLHTGVTNVQSSYS